MQRLEYNSLNPMDLTLYFYGTEDCSSGHSWGPGVRDHFLFHYIHKGKGILRIEDRVYNLKEGEGFLIQPDVVSYYRADDEDPWVYSWIAFNGADADSFLNRANLTSDNPIFEAQPNSWFNNLYDQFSTASARQNSSDLRLQSLLYQFIANLIDEANTPQPSSRYALRKDLYVSKVIDFIGANYSRNIKISEIAHHIGLDRRYLSGLFKASMGVSPQDYLINFRISKACELMKDIRLSIGDVARSVGYDNPLIFSKMFKSIVGVCPRSYRGSL